MISYGKQGPTKVVKLEDLNVLTASQCSLVIHTKVTTAAFAKLS